MQELNIISSEQYPGFIQRWNFANIIQWNDVIINVWILDPTQKYKQEFLFYSQD